MGLILTFLGGFIGFAREEKTQKVNQELAIENKRLIESNLSLSELIKNNLTGGDAFGVVTPMTIVEKGRDVCFLYFENKGGFPLYDVTITLWDPDQIKQNSNSDNKMTTEMLQYYHTENLGNIPSKGGQSFGKTFEVRKDDIVKLNISINAKNGSFSQLLRITKRSGKLCCAKRVSTIGDDSKVIFEESDPNFPRDENGVLNWN